MRREGEDDRHVARPARCDRGLLMPQAARHYGRLPAVKHGSALRAVSLRDGRKRDVRHEA